MSKALAALGLVFTAACLLFGFTHVHASGYGCGSVFIADDKAVSDAVTYNVIVGPLLPHRMVPDCDGARASRLVLTAVFGVAGIGCLTAAAATRQRPTTPPPAPPVLA